MENREPETGNGELVNDRPAAVTGSEFFIPGSLFSIFREPYT
jgi:hypothetical protein